ncbi:PLC-like phosphodiesterase [Limtongia smithiae]|uniref:PLC-like phosphodiesterase n=1 Tax=Limtongia smithiae TaxID=1125753 RepID=UPI0034D0069A
MRDDDSTRGGRVPDPAARWMSAYDDAVPLAMLSIPGTHNSAAHHVSLPSVRCQRSSIREQLDHGVRFLDFRLSKRYFPGICTTSVSSTELYAVHGAFPVCVTHTVSLVTLLGAVYGFLEQHPSETVIISLKGEGPFRWAPHELADILWQTYIEPDCDRWVLDTRMPLLGAARGKIVLFRRFACAPARHSSYGFPAQTWDYNTTGQDTVDGAPLAVQDYCELQSPREYRKKTELVTEHLRRAESMSSETLFLNFTSAAYFWNPRLWPRHISNQIRDGIQSTLRHTQGRCGIVILDFAEANNWALVSAIIEHNQILH